MPRTAAKHEWVAFWSYAGSMRLFTSKNLQPGLHLLSSINQWARFELPFPTFSCLYDGVKTRSRCGETTGGPLKKMQSHADHWLVPKKQQGYARIRHALTPPLIHPSEEQICYVSHCMLSNSLQEIAITSPPLGPSQHLVGFPQRDQWSSVFHLVCVEEWKQKHTNIVVHFLLFWLHRLISIIMTYVHSQFG